MQLIVGLGNPGPRYAATRHNLGFVVVDALARRAGASWRGAHPDYAEARAEGPAGPLTLLKPMTYMNLSGLAVRAWLDATQPPEPIVPVVVCDDLNLQLGSLRIRANGGAGGQKGLASIIETLGTEEIPRVRLGIGPLAGEVLPDARADFVLAVFDPEEAAVAAELVGRAVEAVLACLTEGPLLAGSRFNRRLPAAE